MGTCQSKQCIPQGCCMTGDDNLNTDPNLPPLTITSKTRSNLTLLRVEREKAQTLIPDGMELAPKSVLAKYYPAIGDDVVIGLQMDRKEGFGPIIGPFGSLDFEIFMIIVPFCTLVSKGDQQTNHLPSFWTYRTVMTSSSWITEFFTSIGFGASFRRENILFSPSDSGGFYIIGEDAQKSREIEAQVSWTAGNNFHSPPTEADKEDPGMKLIMALLKQPWTADKDLQRGSYYYVNIDSIEFRKCENIKIYLNDAANPDISGTFDESVVVSAEVKIPELQESLPFNINNTQQQLTMSIIDHINDEGNIEHILSTGGCQSLSNIQNLCQNAIANGDEPDPQKLKLEIATFIKAEAKGHFEVWEYLMSKYFTDSKSREILASTKYSASSLGKSIQDNARKEKGIRTFKNVGGNVKFRPELIKTAKTFDDVIDIMSAAKHGQQTVKAVGTGHSYSLCLETSGYLMKTSGKLNSVANVNKPITGQLSSTMLCEPYKDILQIDGADLIYSKDTYDPETVDENLALFECEAGITIYELIHALELNNLGLQNMGGAAWQTLAGYCSTSTHGSGVRFGPVAEGIKSLVLITSGEWKEDDWEGSMCRMKRASSNLGPDGIYVYRIEPYDGITNLDTYDDAKVSLLQCDDAFNSVRTSFGAFGVIYSITIMVQQFYWLEQKVIESTWEELLENELAPNQENPGQLPTGIKDPRNSMFYWSPYSKRPYGDLKSGKSSPHTVLWFESKVVEKPENYKFKTKKELPSSEIDIFTQGSVRPTVANLVANVMKDKIEKMFTSSVTNGVLKGYKTFTNLEQKIILFIQQLQITYDLTALLFRIVPELIPFITNAAMQTQIISGNKTGKYYYVMLLNVAQNAGFATEYAFPLQKPTPISSYSLSSLASSARSTLLGNDPYEVWPDSSRDTGGYTIQNVKEGIDVISQEARLALSNQSNFFTSPMGVRFVGKSVMPLSMMYGSDACTIELDMAYGTPSGFDTLENIGPKILDVGGRFHWGLSVKNGQSNPTLIQQAYPEVDIWKKVANQLNREKTFSNDFLMALGLSD